MNQRKLIRLGNSSFAIALPKNWVDKSGLKKGDNIFVTPNSNGELIIQPSFKKETFEDEEIINLEKKSEEEIARDIISAYVKGNKLIRVLGEKSKLKIAKEKARIFLNLEPIEETDKNIVFKDLLDIEDIALDNFIRRMDNNLKDIFAILLTNPKDNKGVKEAENIDEDVTKFYFLIWRFVNLGLDNPSIQSNLKINPKSMVFYFWVSYNLEQIGDELKRIIRKISKLNENNIQLNQISKLTCDNYNICMKAFFSKNKESAKEIILKKEEFLKMCEKLAENKDYELIVDKIKSINAHIHHNAKMVFYNL